ncbi:60S acidic ribosomal protein P2-like [Camellia sinensis]|uniref:60S acidic ribosomal protein P2-like n=1 Tax=Camellia sinensis TaxID=4442 RepID=UPI001035C076|nr:60S acidic ribosomal protein P2-like [Camellia sinensis]
MADGIPRGGTPPEQEMDPDAELLPLSVRPFDPVTYRPAIHVLPPDGLRQFRTFDRGVPRKLLLCEPESHLSYGASETVGAEADDDRIQLLLSEVKGKDITELIASGREKLASVPSGGGDAVAVTSYGGGATAAAPAAAEPKKEEKVEDKEESDDDMGFSLFD